MHPVQLAFNRNMFHANTHTPTQNMLTPTLEIKRFICLFESKVVNTPL